ncbi:molybdate transport system substrate-binding protein [Fulvimarina pelagi HTCC2506]|uniref:Molybdate transport system substrate-binding protein n=1 Tax=Fulvimarina pelagi HTCC2506 TaxID=314231 RepID=Q0G6V9_9HYPH|nr:molybdate ABC transporter substrate-binding protein [Fulvimarina pelagi]EAU42605.1 molybdate transport system substrate-binding protein [Fulvimarina pelagi HTCC2506]
MRHFSRAILAALSFFFPVLADAKAAETMVAVAANFAEPAREIADDFGKVTGHTAVLSFGSTGQLFTQIEQGAPFDVFLAADTERPALAVEEALGVAGSVFTYAIGAIVLYSPDSDLVRGEDTLRNGDFGKLAIANPETAPYGAAAVETMRRLGVYDALEAKLVRGNNIAQAYQFVQTGNAELGFVASSQVVDSGGSKWFVPANLYTPVRQDAVLLMQGADDDAARAFVEYLQSPAARAIIRRYGYEIDTPEPRT